MIEMNNDRDHPIVSFARRFRCRLATIQARHQSWPLRHFLLLTPSGSQRAKRSVDLFAAPAALFVLSELLLMVWVKLNQPVRAAKHGPKKPLTGP